ncbi:MAG TPA: hypothetical protein VL088_09030 [Pedobacter sp.]|nr:hypothetical protein [Pedobacter sp.]
MKKLTLKLNAFSQGEVLTRAQLKKVVGGNGSGFEDGCIETPCPANQMCCPFIRQSSVYYDCATAVLMPDGEFECPPSP